MTIRRRNHGQEVAELLKAWRTTASLTQKVAAEKLGVSLRTYQAWEIGRGMPYPKLLALALKAFK
jgi:transcriptional regulator with XRE-family HTH domain